MKFREIKLAFNTNRLHTTTIPLNCPYCGIPTHLNPIQTVRSNTYDNVQCLLQVFKTPCCSKYIFATYKLENNSYKYLSSYPNIKPSALPNSIQKLSSRFIDLYADSELAYSKNMFELAGSGFRNALEVLIKDYAIAELKEDKDKVSNMSLFDAIESYLPDKQLKQAADVVRILGNDFTHYERKYEQYDVDILKMYLDIFIKRIDAEYLMSHPPVYRLQKNQD